MVGNIVELLSKDRLADLGEEHSSSFVNFLTEDVLNNFGTNDVPPHKLSLKQGDVCLVMRNLSKKNGITNNTRVLILEITRYRIVVQPIGTTHTYSLPRIYFKFTPKRCPFQILRLQFPLKLAYAMTINKSQGQTLSRVLLDVRKPVFMHGQLYVALSRVRERSNIAIMVDEKDESYYTLNRVFQELLLVIER